MSLRTALVLSLSALLLMFVSVLGRTQTEVPTLLEEVEQKYQKAVTLSAKFTQVVESAAFKKKEKSTGLIRFKRPDKIRWETHEPDMNVLVSDGKKFWFYTPPFDPEDPTDRGQVMEKKASEVQSRLAQMLLSGRFSLAKDMRIKQEGPTTFVLKPKKGSAGPVSVAEIEIDPQKKLIQKVTLSYRGGNRTEVSLSEIELGVELPDLLFAFTPPPNTDRQK